MLNYDYDYYYYQPPISPWTREQLDAPLEIFKIPDMMAPNDPIRWLPSKPAWAAVWMISGKVEGYYDAQNDVHIWIGGVKPSSDEWFKNNPNDPGLRGRRWPPPTWAYKK